MQNNPQVKATVDYIQQTGQSPKELFYALAKQKGVDPNQILQLFK